MKAFVCFIVCFYFSVCCAFADDTGSITYLSRWPTTAANVITKVGDHVLYGDGEVIAVYNATDFTPVARVSIRLTGQEDLDSQQASGTEGITGLFHAAGFLYVACGNEGLQIYELPADLATFSASNLRSTYLVEKEIILLEQQNVRASVRDVAVSGNFAFIGYYWLTYDGGFDSGVRVIDVSDPDNPYLVKEAQIPPTWVELNRVQSLSVAGGYVYVTDLYNGLVIFDINDPLTPVIEAVCYMPQALDVSVAGNYAYVACAKYGLMVVDVNPANFTEERDVLPSLAFCQYNDNLTKTASVATNNGYAYIGDVDIGLLIVDISSPEFVDNNSVIGRYEEDIKGVYRLYLDAANQAVYVGDCRKGLQKIDVSVPTAPALLAATESTSTPADGDTVLVDTDSGYVFTLDDDVSYGNMREGIRILFAIISEDYVTFLLKGMIPTDGEASDLYYLNGYLYVADGSDGLKIIDPGLPEDSAEPVNPVLTGRCPIAGGNANGVFVLDGYAYVAAGSGGLKIVDVFDPARPTVISELAGDDVSDAQKVIVKADYAFVADGRNGLKTVDISDKNQPVLAGTYFIDDSDDLDDEPGYAHEVSVVGTLAYVAAGNEGFYVIIVEDPYNLRYLGDYSANPYEQIQAIYAARSDVSEGVDLIWVANGTMPSDNFGFFINPSTVPPQRSVAYHTSGNVKDVSVKGDYAFIGDGSGGFQVLTVLEGEAEGGDDWDDNVVPIDIHQNKHEDSGCFVRTVLSGFADSLWRLIATRH